MSTLDPNLEPPGDWQTPYGAPPPSGRPPEAAGRAAVYLWLSAGLQLALSACCGLSAVALMAMNPDDLMREIPPDFPNRDMLRQSLPMLGPVLAIGTAALLLIPSIVLGVLAFKVREASRGAAIVAMIVLGTQTVGLGLIAALNLLAALFSRSLSDIFVVLLMATVLALFVKTLVELFGVLNGTRPPPPDGVW